MVLRYLLRYFANNEQLVQRLADSFIMRKAARFVVSTFYRSKIYAEERGLGDVNSQRIKSILKKFSENMKEEIKSAKDELQKRK